MGIRVEYQPNPYLIGQAAMQAGMGDQNRWRYEQEAQQNLQQAQMDSQAARYQAQIDAERQQQEEQRRFQSERDMWTQGQSEAEKERDRSFTAERDEWRADEKKDFEKEFGYTAQQEYKRQQLQSGLDKIMQDPRFTPQEKEFERRKIEAEMIGIKPTQPIESIQEWIKKNVQDLPDGGRIIRDPDGSARYVPPPKKEKEDDSDFKNRILIQRAMAAEVKRLGDMTVDEQTATGPVKRPVYPPEELEKRALENLRKGPLGKQIDEMFPKEAVQKPPRNFISNMLGFASQALGVADDDRISSSADVSQAQAGQRQAPPQAPPLPAFDSLPKQKQTEVQSLLDLARKAAKDGDQKLLEEIKMKATEVVKGAPGARGEEGERGPAGPKEEAKKIAVKRGVAQLLGSMKNPTRAELRAKFDAVLARMPEDQHEAAEEAFQEEIERRGL